MHSNFFLHFLNFQCDLNKRIHILHFREDVGLCVEVGTGGCQEGSSSCGNSSQEKLGNQQPCQGWRMVSCEHRRGESLVSLYLPPGHTERLLSQLLKRISLLHGWVSLNYFQFDRLLIFLSCQVLMSLAWWWIFHGVLTEPAHILPLWDNYPGIILIPNNWEFYPGGLEFSYLPRIHK